MHITRSWKAGAVALAVVLVVAMGVVLGAAAVQRRALDAPEFDLALGPAKLSTFVTTTPNCSTAAYGTGRGIACSGQSIFSTTEYYAIWLKLRSKRGAVTVEHATRLFVVSLGEPRRPSHRK